MQINYQKIYERLGYPFYAIAAADNVVTKNEVSRLKEMVQNVWVPIEETTDEFGTDAAQYISISFDYLMNEGVEADQAFDGFKDYYVTHPAAFSKNIRRNMKTTASAIAEAFRGRNKQESAFLEKLNDLLE